MPRQGMPAEEVIDFLARNAEPGLMAMPSGRFFGWVIGGTLPAALASDWLVSAWDQNACFRYATPAAAAIEESAGAWLLELLGLPRESDVGFVTGATMANFTGMAAARWRLLTDAGWDLDRDGLAGAPRIRCYVGRERHETVDLGLRYLGLGLLYVSSTADLFAFASSMSGESFSARSYAAIASSYLPSLASALPWLYAPSASPTSA